MSGAQTLYKMADPLPKYARVDVVNPTGWSMCDRCGFYFNRNDLVWQYEWAGNSLYNTGVLVCTVGPRCFDTPDEQLRTIILPPDPPPIVNARVPDFDYEEQTAIQTQAGGPPGINNQLPPWNAGPQMLLCDQTGTLVLIYQYPTIQQIS
jgi:hypothetical protein